MELKFFDTFHADVLATGSGRFSDLLIPVTQGPNESEFVGRRINVTKIQTRVRMLLPTDASADRSSDVVRLTLVLDTQNNQDSVDGSYLDDGGSVAVSGSWFGFQEPTQQERFRYIWEEDFKVNAGGSEGTTTVQNNVYSVEEHKVFIPITYQPIGGGLHRPRGNAIYLVATTAASRCHWELGTRVWYYDG